MADQAEGLRDLAHRARSFCELDDCVASVRRTARIIAVTSGKGGVGKTHICSNLALLMARSGQRVILLDADLGLANVHVILGLEPSLSIADVLQGQKSFQEILTPGPEGLQIIAGGAGLLELADLSAERRQLFIADLQQLDLLADVVLIDTGAGLSSNVRAFVLAAEEVILVTTPEPTALTDAYAVIKTVVRENPETHLRLLVNMTSGGGDGPAAAKRLEIVARQFLNVELDILGFIPHDAAVTRAVRVRKALVLASPNAPAARAMSRVVASLGYHAPGRAGIAGFLQRMSSSRDIYHADCNTATGTMSRKPIPFSISSG